MSDNIFSNLPNNLIMKIIKINTERERDEQYKKNYHDFVNNFRNRVKGDSGDYIYNDITYDWLYRLETYKFNKDINDHNELRMCISRASLQDIKACIDDGLVYNF